MFTSTTYHSPRRATRAEIELALNAIQHYTNGFGTILQGNNELVASLYDDILGAIIDENDAAADKNETI